jgi:flagellar biogenesis protein FliO
VTAREPIRLTQAFRAAATTLLLLAVCLSLPAPARAADASGGAPTANAAVSTAATPAPPKSALEQGAIRRPPDAASAGNRATTQKTGLKPGTSTTTSSGFGAGRVMTALAVVVILILLLRWAAKRFFGVSGAGRSTRAVQVLSRSPISPRQQLVLLRVGRRLLVVADGGGQMNTLSEITDPDEVAALIGQLQDDHGERATKTFGSLFGKMRGTYEAEADSADAEPASPAPGRMAEHDEGENDPAVVSTRHELSGLMDKVRMLSRQFKS